ncbi:hypothetical protein ACMYYO_10125 [Dermacoccaceae bacterium W4C1]
MDVITSVTDQVVAQIRGRDVIVVCPVLAGATRHVQQLRSYGAGRILVLSLSQGTGELPQDAECHLLPGPPQDSIAEEIAAADALVNAPSIQGKDAVEAFDPRGEALVYLSTMTAIDGNFLGRTTIGGRPRAFERWEDKTRSAALWDAAIIPRAAELVCAADRDLLRENASRLDLGHGTVWSADASAGFNGGADRVHWVRNEAEAEAALAALAPVSEQIRMMPFLEGVPCSIHGIVLPDGVAVLRPVELVVLRPADGTRFVYAATATGWDPSAQHREQMRSAARAVGAYLAGTQGYRGAFGLDGVLTTEGFRPTELNPRFSGGLSTLAKAIPDLPLTWVHLSALAGLPVGASAPALEEALVGAADAHRAGSAYAAVALPGHAEQRTDTESIPVGPEQGLLPGELQIGPSPRGALIRYQPQELPTGTRMADLAVTAFALADRLWDTGFGHLEAAPETAAG